MDQEFIRSIKAGENHLLETFYKKNFPIITQYIKQNIGNDEDVKDVFQSKVILQNEYEGVIINMYVRQEVLFSELRRKLFFLLKECKIPQNKLYVQE